MERAEKKRKLANRAARRRANSAAKVSGPTRSTSLAHIGMGSANAMAKFTSGIASILRSRPSTLIRRHTWRSQNEGDTQDVEEALHFAPDPAVGDIEMDDIRPATRPPSQGRGRGPIKASRNPNSTTSDTSSTSATPSIHMPRSVAQILAFPTTWLQVHIRRVRRAHEDAAKKQALERAERRQQIFAYPTEGDVSTQRRDEQPESSTELRSRKAKQRAHAEAANETGDGVGWGLGSFGIKEHRESAVRLQIAKDQLQKGRLLNPTAEVEENETGRSTQLAVTETTTAVEEGDWEDVDDSTSTVSGAGRKPEERATNDERNKPPDRNDGSGAGWSWWGPLKDWRLSDRSVF